MLKSSIERNTFLKNSYIEHMAKEGRTPENDIEVEEKVKMYESLNDIAKEREADPKWQENNLEYDLRSTEWIAEKCKDKVYSQHLYAALCNNDFIKNDVWPRLQDKRWHCSWRYAGGIVADIREEGDYIDWYCSGLRTDAIPEEMIDNMTEDQKQMYKEFMAFVIEGIVTDEIKNDLFKLGWLVVENQDG